MSVVSCMQFIGKSQGIAVAKTRGQVVMKYGRGDYFGELALLNDEPRAATVEATTNCKVVSIASDSFKVSSFQKTSPRLSMFKYTSALKEIELLHALFELLQGLFESFKGKVDASWLPKLAQLISVFSLIL